MCDADDSDTRLALDADIMRTVTTGNLLRIQWLGSSGTGPAMRLLCGAGCLVSGGSCQDGSAWIQNWKLQRERQQRKRKHPDTRGQLLPWVTQVRRELFQHARLHGRVPQGTLCTCPSSSMSHPPGPPGPPGQHRGILSSPLQLRPQEV